VPLGRLLFEWFEQETFAAKTVPSIEVTGKSWLTVTGKVKYWELGAKLPVRLIRS
jgi:hypothetical protein